MRFISSVVVVAALVGCSSSGPSGPGPDDPPRGSASCPVPQDARMLLMTTALGALHEIAYVAEHASASERPYALGLAGSSQTMIGTASSIEPCTSARTYDPFCRSDDRGAGEPGAADGTKNGCFRLGCEAAGIGLVDVYFVDGATRTPDQSAPLSYATSTPMPNGRMECATNPLRRYRLDVRDPARSVIDASLASSCRFVPASGVAVDLTHEGTAHAVHEGTIEKVTVSLKLTKLGGAPVEVNIEQADENGPTGTVQSRGEVIARFRAGAPPFAWEGACAQ